MEAPITRVVLRTTVGRFVLLAALLLVSMGASRRTANFIVETDDPNFAQQVSAGGGKVSPRTGRSRGSARRCPTGSSRA